MRKTDAKKKAKASRRLLQRQQRDYEISSSPMVERSFSKHTNSETFADVLVLSDETLISCFSRSSLVLRWTSLSEDNSLNKGDYRPINRYDASSYVYSVIEWATSDGIDEDVVNDIEWGSKTTILISSADKTVTEWNVQTGERLSVINDLTSSAYRMLKLRLPADGDAQQPSSSRLLVCGLVDGHIVIYVQHKVATNNKGDNEEHRNHQQQTTVPQRYFQRTKVINASNYITCLCGSDGWFVSGSDDGSLKLWNTRDDRINSTMSFEPGHTDRVMDVKLLRLNYLGAVADDEQGKKREHNQLVERMVSCAQDDTLVIWDLKSASPVYSTDFSPCGRHSLV